MKKFIRHKSANSASTLASKIDLGSARSRRCIRLAPSLYENIILAKKGGGERNISAPRADLKTLQRSILDALVETTPLPPYIYGFSRRKTIVDNARYHANNKYLLNLDIKDFFPSVHYERVRQLFRDLGCTEEVIEDLTKLTTLDYGLPQGAPTSPFLATLALANLDRRLIGLAKSNHLSYTRYFDDLCFSGDKRVGQIEMDIRRIIRSEGYAIKIAKRRFITPGQIKIVNGISIKPSGELFLENSDELLEYVGLLAVEGLSRLKSDNPEKERLSLMGKISFLRSVAPTTADVVQTLFEKISW